MANRLLKRIRDFAQVQGISQVNTAIVESSLKALGIDEMGLEELDRKILELIITKFKGGPVGIDTISASIGEERVTIEDADEPYLMQLGLLARTPKGRVVTEDAYKHLGLKIPAEGAQISF